MLLYGFGPSEGGGERANRVCTDLKEPKEYYEYDCSDECSAAVGAPPPDCPAACGNKDMGTFIEDILGADANHACSTTCAAEGVTMSAISAKYVRVEFQTTEVCRLCP